jgi:hypothetical protein
MQQQLYWIGNKDHWHEQQVSVTVTPQTWIREVLDSNIDRVPVVGGFVLMFVCVCVCVLF